MGTGSQNLIGFDPTDPLQVAVKVTRLEDQLVRSQESFNHTAEALRDGVEGLRSDLRGVADQLKELPKLAAGQQSQDNGLGRAFKAIENLANETSTRFRERDQSLQTWCDDYEKERDRWRTSHEEDNRNTREKLILWNGVGIGISLLATTLVGTILYIYAGDKAAQREAVARVEARVEADKVAATNRTEANGARLTEVERYLTQEGTANGRPYVPTARR